MTFCGYQKTYHFNNRMLLKCFRFGGIGGSYERPEYDDNDSRYSFSSSSSPLQTMLGCSDNGTEMLNLSSSAEMSNNHNNSSDMHCDKLDDDSKELLPMSPDSHSGSALGGVQIISASAGHIIAVANPALALSPALTEGTLNVKREVVSPDVL